MEFIRKSAWALFAVLALGYQSTQAMEKEKHEHHVRISPRKFSQTHEVAEETSIGNITIDYIKKFLEKNKGKSITIDYCLAGINSTD